MMAFDGFGDIFAFSAKIMTKQINKIIVNNKL